MGLALITGASAGLGAEFADLFAADGHDVILCARRRPELEDLAKRLRAEHGVEARVIAIDLAEPGAGLRLAQEVDEAGREVDFLVNNAGFGHGGPLAALDTASVEGMIRVNIEALTLLAHHYVQKMIKRDQGKIMNVGSVAGFQPGPGMAVYYATKAYVYSLTEAMVEECRASQVSVTNLAPGPTRTEFQEVAGIERTRLSEHAIMDAREVAEAGYAGMMRGDELVIPGFTNKVGAQIAPLLPRALVRRFVAKLNAAR